MPRRALIVGSSGLVGAGLLQLLLDHPDYAAVTAPGRRPAAIAHPKLRAPVVSFDDPARFAAEAACDDAFCCLGTTIKLAGSQAAFRRVDHDYPLAWAQAALAAGARQFLCVTAVGADSRSSVFYSRVKGELESALQALPFPDGVRIVRPSFLDGERAAPRAGEGLALAVARLLRPAFAGPLLKYRVIAGADVARALLAAALREPPGNRTFQGRELFALASV